jgi:hypothetical protein
MQTVLGIASAGALLLFAALAGLVGLMYLLTSPLLFVKRTRASTHTSSTDESGAEARETEEPERRRRAVALVVAVACAEADHSSMYAADEPANWRLLHRSLRLRQRVTKRGVAE